MLILGITPLSPGGFGEVVDIGNLEGQPEVSHDIKGVKINRASPINEASTVPSRGKKYIYLRFFLFVCFSLF